MSINDPDGIQPLSEVIILQAQEATREVFTEAQYAIARSLDHLRDRGQITTDQRPSAEVALTLALRDEFAKRLDALGIEQVDRAVHSWQTSHGLSFTAALKAIADIAGRSPSGIRFAWGRPRPKKATT